MVESKGDHNAAKVHPKNLVCDPQLELEGVAIPWSSSIREFQKGHAHYLAEALEQPLLLPKDIC